MNAQLFDSDLPKSRILFDAANDLHTAQRVILLMLNAPSRCHHDNYLLAVEMTNRALSTLDSYLPSSVPATVTRALCPTGGNPEV